MATVSRGLSRRALKEYQSVTDPKLGMAKALSLVLNEVNRGHGHHRPVCAKCEKEMEVVQNGVGVEDMADWGPCQIWDADLYKCRQCGHEAVLGFGSNPISYHNDPNFQKERLRYIEKTRLIKNR